MKDQFQLGPTIDLMTNPFAKAYLGELVYDAFRGSFGVSKGRFRVKSVNRQTKTVEIEAEIEDVFVPSHGDVDCD